MSDEIPRGGEIIELRPESRWTRQQIEDHLAHELTYWLPIGGEAGEIAKERQRSARAAAKIIAGRLADV